ncbi:MAG: HAMP domain-containing histidine kinase [Campylobacter sp.]|nr:HAMP domain-containing histidine kinase [Campylobacter sp.]
MQKSFKVPFIAIAVIMVLFIYQSYIILGLAIKNEISSATFSMMDFENSVKNVFNTSESLPTSLTYRYAILDEKGQVVFSNLQKALPNIDEKNFVNDGILYYKNFFFSNEKPYFIVITQELNDKRKIFLVGLMLAIFLLVVVFVFYLSYFATIKPYRQAQKYLNDFFNDAMHELKTPLGVAKINLEMLASPSKHAKRIQNALKQMQIAYDDVEYFIKRGYIKFPKESIELSEFICERIRFLASVADVKNIKFSKNLQTNFIVNISKTALTRLIDNTITNAIKYSPKDSQIIITLSLCEGGAEFSVQDFGIGIKDIKRIFKRYEREDSVQGGFGIGLNIVSEICRQNDIDCKVVSKPNEGSTFSYKFKKLP